MAVKISSGDLRHKVVFKQPVSSLNNEAGRELDYSTPATTIETRAHIEKFDQRRNTEAYINSLTTVLDFYVRYSTSLSAVNKDWIITYDGDDYVIHEIERYDQKKQFLRFTGKVQTNG